mmetsp:Transcript_66610/g.214654  ORF Transcript_66610/g.214654 Transcript_66610/m.214654 type:complete len:235 (-) Transcript_66610:543-1247(-)
MPFACHCQRYWRRGVVLVQAFVPEDLEHRICQARPWPPWASRRGRCGRRRHCRRTLGASGLETEVQCGNGLTRRGHANDVARLQCHVPVEASAIEERAAATQVREDEGKVRPPPADCSAATWGHGADLEMHLARHRLADPYQLLPKVIALYVAAHAQDMGGRTSAAWGELTGHGAVDALQPPVRGYGAEPAPCCKVDSWPLLRLARWQARTQPPEARRRGPEEFIDAHAPRRRC